MLEATIIGNIGADAVIKDFNGAKYIAFNVAHSERYTDANGNPTERTTWVSVLKPAREGDRLCQYLTKGMQVYLRGNISARCYQSQLGWQAGLNLHCTQLQLLGGSGQQKAAPQPAQPTAQATPQPAQTTAPANQALNPNDDLPF